MGKYMRKSKLSGGEVAVMDMSHHSPPSLGVRTRAKTLALQKSAAASGCSDDGCYMQLRSRRRVGKPRIVVEAKRPKCPPKEKGLQLNSEEEKIDNEKIENDKIGENSEEKKVEEIEENLGNEENVGKRIDDAEELEGSFGENVPEFEAKERTTRETTPCSLIRDPENIRTPGSSTRPTYANHGSNTRAENPMLRDIPTSREVNEFFSGAEKQQQLQFVEKYNFDPVNDKPLPGRYEWVKIKP